MSKLTRAPLILALILATACGEDSPVPTEVEPVPSVVGSYDPVPEVAYVGGVYGPNVTILSVPEMTEIGRIDLPLEDPRQMTISPDGRFMYVTHRRPAGVTRVDLHTGALLETVDLPTGSRPSALEVTPDGARLFVTLVYAHQVAAVDTRTMEVLKLIPLTDDTDYVAGITVGPGGRQVFVTSRLSGRVHVIDTRSLQVVGRVETGADLNEVGVTPGGGMAFATSATTGEVFAIDLRTYSVLAVIPVEGARGVAVPQGGKEVYITGRGPTVIIDVEGLEVVATFPYSGIRIVANTSGRLAMTTGEAVRLFQMPERDYLTEVYPEHPVWDADFAVKPRLAGQPTTISLNGAQYSAISPPELDRNPCGWSIEDTAVYTRWDRPRCESTEGVSPWVEYEVDLAKGVWTLGVVAINHGPLGDDVTRYPEFLVGTNVTAEPVRVPAHEYDPQTGTVTFEARKPGPVTVRLWWLNDWSAPPDLDANIKILRVFFEPRSDDPEPVETVSTTGVPLTLLPAYANVPSAWAWAVNNKGQVAGHSDTPQGPRATLWIGGDASSPADGAEYDATTTYDLNNAGQLAGAYRFHDRVLHAVRWDADGDMVELGDLGGPSSALGVNDHGDVAGVSQIPSGEARAFLWTEGGGMVNLGTLGGASRAWAINGHREVVGSSYLPSGALRGFRWTPRDGMTALSTLGGDESSAVAINDRGEIAGHSELPTGDFQAVRWSPHGDIEPLGSLGGWSLGYGINERGDVVGYSVLPDGERHAFLWTARDGMIDLGALPGGGGWTVALDLNEKGDIVGYGLDSEGEARAVVWHTERR